MAQKCRTCGHSLHKHQPTRTTRATALMDFLCHCGCRVDGAGRVLPDPPLSNGSSDV